MNQDIDVMNVINNSKTLPEIENELANIIKNDHDGNCPSPENNMPEILVNEGEIEVGVVMGSTTDWPIMKYCVELLLHFNVKIEYKVLSAHRMPDEMFAYAEQAYLRGLKVIIAGAGGAAHLPGMLAAKTFIPVLGVPMVSKYLKGLDSLYSIVQMPKGIPVGTFAIGEAGAQNAALFAVSILALNNKIYAQKLLEYRNNNNKIAKNSVLDLG